jgi:hypothetical protein
LKVKAVWVGKWARNIFKMISSNWSALFHFSFNLVYMRILFVEGQKYENPQGGCEYIISEVL